MPDKQKYCVPPDGTLGVGLTTDPHFKKCNNLQTMLIRWNHLSRTWLKSYFFAYLFMYLSYLFKENVFILELWLN